MWNISDKDCNFEWRIDYLNCLSEGQEEKEKVSKQSALFLPKAVWSCMKVVVMIERAHRVWISPLEPHTGFSKRHRRVAGFTAAAWLERVRKRVLMLIDVWVMVELPEIELCHVWSANVCDGEVKKSYFKANGANSQHSESSFTIIASPGRKAVGDFVHSSRCALLKYAQRSPVEGFHLIKHMASR